MPTNKFVISKPKSSITKLPERGMKKHDFIDDFKEYYVHLLGRDENCRSPFYAGEARWLTPIILCCPKRWKNGRLN
jgi:starch phosphorylase